VNQNGAQNVVNPVTGLNLNGAEDSKTDEFVRVPEGSDDIVTEDNYVRPNPLSAGGYGK
jgi:hypothetical protein